MTNGTQMQSVWQWQQQCLIALLTNTNEKCSQINIEKREIIETTIIITKKVKICIC